VRGDLESLFPDNQKPKWTETWDRQVENIFETYWQVYPWRPEGHLIQDIDYKFLDPHKPFLGDRLTETERILKVYAKHDKDGGGQYHPNIGAIYSDLYFITEKALGSRKALRNFAQVPEHGDKSTLGGDRAALYDGIDQLITPEGDFDRKGRQDIIRFWRDLSRKLQNKGRFEIQESGQERLDAIELTKRCAWRSYFRKEFEFKDKDLRFPSTSSITTASFKFAIIQAILDPKNSQQELIESLNRWIASVIKSPLKRQNRTRPDVIPLLFANVQSAKNNISKKLQSLLISFLSMDGRLLFEEAYQEELGRKKGGSQDFYYSQPDRRQIDQALYLLKKLVGSASKVKIDKPRKYFAVLMMDGDNMGSWISGEKMPEYRKLLHPDTQKKLETDPTYKESWEPILSNPRLMSPAIHGFISKALGDFSLKLVRHIVEERYAGKLVYAGGDDVMALLPLDCALDVARELRAAFSGELTTNDQGEDLKVDFAAKESQASKSGYVLLKRPNRERELLTTMGSEATASTGIVIAHHTQPLDLTLQEVRKAEKAAKSAGRNSFSLTFLKRSGEIMSAGAKWYYPENLEDAKDKSLDTVDLLLKFQDYFAKKNISSKFPYVLREQSETLAPIENEAMYASEIKRLLHRQQGKEKLDKLEEETLAAKLAQVVDRANRADKAYRATKKDNKPPTQLRTFADLLVFTRFLANGEGEE
jgi:CRISPR-associated protein Cmr2